ncbi:MAG TPA: hypothetical protein VEI47_02750 [Gemmatimonadales bacterium]|nr:hypothetical protein [Gemmatimonadales bacterium]
MPPVLSRTLVALAGLAAGPTLLGAQGAVDPSITPRAAQLARIGDRPQATEMLGRYLATAPDDGTAWLELGQLYLADSREWHRAGHVGEPSGALFLDFAVTATDQALRLPTDSASLVRAILEVERGASAIEVNGWKAVHASFAIAASAAPPPFVAEMGQNLVNSCPMGGVLVTGSDLEAAGVWSVVFQRHRRGDLLLVLATRFAGDSIYRREMSQALEVPDGETTRMALASAAARRPVCLSPGTDTTYDPDGAFTAIRLVRVTGLAAAEAADPLSVAELLDASYRRSDALTAEVLGLYRRAARANPLLCTSLLAPLGATGRDGCGR